MTLSGRSNLETNNRTQEYFQGSHRVSAIELDRMHSLLDLLEDETRILQSAQSFRMMDNIIQLRKQMNSIYTAGQSVTQSLHNPIAEAGDQLNRYWDFP